MAESLGKKQGQKVWGKNRGRKSEKKTGAESLGKKQGQIVWGKNRGRKSGEKQGQKVWGKTGAESLKTLVYDPLNLFPCIVHCPGHIFMGESFQDYS